MAPDLRTHRLRRRANAFEGVVALDVEARHEMNPKTGRKDAETWPNPGMHGFLDFTLDSRRQLLLRGAESIRLRGRTYDVLSYLVTHAGRLVSKRELMESVWGDVAVTDDSLVQCLIEIRRALGDDHDVVKTIRGRGYLFDATVRPVAEDPDQTRDPDRTVPIRVTQGLEATRTPRSLHATINSGRESSPARCWALGSLRSRQFSTQTRSVVCSRADRHSRYAPWPCFHS